MKIPIVVEIEVEVDGIECADDCRGCCNKAGDAEWSMPGVEGWTRGQECLEAEQRIETIRREARVEGMRTARTAAGEVLGGYIFRAQESFSRDRIAESAVNAVQECVSLIDALIAKEEAKA